MSFAEYLMQDKAFLEKRIREQDDYIRYLDDKVISRKISHDTYIGLFDSAFAQRVKFTDALYSIEQRKRLGNERGDLVWNNNKNSVEFKKNPDGRYRIGFDPFDNSNTINNNRVAYPLHYINL